MRRRCRCAAPILTPARAHARAPPAQHEPPRAPAAAASSTARGRGAVRVRRQPGRDDARPGPGAARAGPGRPVHRRPRAGAHRHRRAGRRRAAVHHPLRGRRHRPLVRVVHPPAHAAGSSSRSARAARTTSVAAALAVRLGFPAASFDPDPAAHARAGRARRWRCRGRPGAARARRRPCSSPPCSRRSPTAAPASTMRRARCRLPAYVPLRDASYPLTLISPATNRTINSMLGEVHAAGGRAGHEPADAAARRADRR